MTENQDQVALYRNFAQLLAQWIEDNLETRLDISIVAEKAGYSKWHLQRIFKAATGYALASYIRQRRLTAAALRLRETGDSILSVAMRYNFDSQQSFSRTFKQHFASSPQSYRRQDVYQDELLLQPYVPVAPAVQVRSDAETRAEKAAFIPALCGRGATEARPAF